MINKSSGLFWMKITAITLLVFFTTLIFATNSRADGCSFGPGKNLSNCDFSGTDFGTANLSGSNLTGANLSGAVLRRANLNKIESGSIQGIPESLPTNWQIARGYLIGPTANLSGANLQGIVLDSSNLSYSNLTGADLSKSSLFAAQLVGVNAANLNLSGAQAFSANFSSANLSKANLSNGGFESSIFTSADLSFSNLGSANLEGTSLDQISLWGSNAQRLRAVRVKGTPTSLPEGWHLVAGSLVGPGADASRTEFAAANFKGMQLEGIDFSSSLFSGGDFSEANFENADFHGAVIGVDQPYRQWGPCATFQNSNFKNVNFTNIAIGPFSIPAYKQGGELYERTVANDRVGCVGASKASFGGANYENASFAGATLAWIDFSNSNFRKTNLAGAIFNPLNNISFVGVKSGEIRGTPTTFLSGYDLDSGFLIGPYVDLSNSDLTYLTLGGIDLTGANLSFTNLSGKDLSGANLKSANLSGANLSWASLTGANLGDATLSGADISSADFSLVSLEGVRTGELMGDASNLPSGWFEIFGYFLGPKANLSNAKLDGLDLSQRDLHYANFSNASLKGVTFKNSNLANTNFSSANLELAVLSHANLSNANISSANLRQTDLSDANLSAGNLSNARLNSAKLARTNLSSSILKDTTLNSVSSGSIIGSPVSLPLDWQLAKGYLVGPWADLSGADLSGLVFQNVNLSNSNLVDANLGSSSLSNAVLQGVSSGRLRGIPNSLPISWKLVDGYLIGPGANLSYANLKTADLTGSQLSNAVLELADLSEASMGAVASGGIVGLPKLPSSWKLVNGYLVGPEANLRGARLTGQDLTGSNLFKANLDGADLSNTNLMSVSSGFIKGTPSMLPSQWRLFMGYLVGPGANLAGANLNGGLSNVNLSGTNLDSADLGIAVLNNITSGRITGEPRALPRNWRLIGGYLVGPTANLSNAMFAGLDLSNCDLSDANLQNADLSDANISGCKLDGVRSGSIIGDTARLPLDWKFISGYLVGPKVNLSYADISGLDFSEANLTGGYIYQANIEATSFSSATLTGLASGRLIGTPAKLPDNWRLIRGYFVGPGADLTGAVFSGSNLSGLNLSFVNFANSNLSGADLHSTDLSGAILENANLTDSILTGVNLNRSALNNADFFGASLSNFNAVGVTGRPFRLPHGFELRNDIVAQTFTQAPIPVVAGVFKVGQTLNANLGNWDSDTVLGLQWTRDGTQIPSATNSNYQLTYLDLGHQIAVQVTAEKKGYFKETKSSSNNLVQLGSLTLESPVINGQPQIGKTLSIETESWGPEITRIYRWYKNGIPIPAARDSAYVITAGDVGQQITADVAAAKDGYQSATFGTNGLVVSLSPMPFTRPTLTGTVKVGKLMRASTKPWLSGATVKYQWLLDGKPIKRATQVTYKILASQRGHSISVEVTQIKIGYIRQSAVSKAIKVN